MAAITAAWEYKVLSTTLQVPEKQLNVLGAEGWELVNVTVTVKTTGTPFSEYAEYVSVFKRQQQVEQRRGMGSA